MLACRNAEAIALGERAIALAEATGRGTCSRTRATTSASRGCAAATKAGMSISTAALAIALDAGLEDDAARAYVNLATIAVELREPDRAARHLADGIAFCAERDLGTLAALPGGLPRAGAAGRGPLGRGGGGGGRAGCTRGGAARRARIAALAVRARVRARRGDPDVWAPLDEALELARGMDEVQRPRRGRGGAGRGPLAARRRRRGRRERRGETLALAAGLGDRWVAGRAGGLAAARGPC